MDVKQIAKDTAKTLQSYLTYQAVKVVMAQLNETDPPLGFWLHHFSSKEKIQDGEAYIQALFQEKQALALRILTVREHLAQEVTDFLPEMICTGIAEANMEHRRQQLERLTQLNVSSSSLTQTPTVTEPQPDNQSS